VSLPTLVLLLIAKAVLVSSMDKKNHGQTEVGGKLVGKCILGKLFTPIMPLFTKQ